MLQIKSLILSISALKYVYTTYKVVFCLVSIVFSVFICLFYGNLIYGFNQAAEDHGGPRKEFFRLVLNEIKNEINVFDKGLRTLLSEKYKPIGILLGM